MKAQQHKIRSMDVVLEMPWDAPASRLRNRIVQAIRTRLPERLERLFSAYITPDTLVKIEDIEIDLGVLDTKALEEDFEAALEAKLEEIIRNIQGNKVLGISVPAAEMRSEADALLFYLREGGRPWWWTSPTRHSPAEMLQHVYGQNPAALAALLREHVQQAGWVQRLERILSPALRLELIYLLSGNREMGEWLARLARQPVPATRHIAGFQASRWAGAVWQTALRFLPQQHPGALSSEKLLAAILQALSALFHLDAGGIVHAWKSSSALPESTRSMLQALPVPVSAVSEADSPEKTSYRLDTSPGWDWLERGPGQGKTQKIRLRHIHSLGFEALARLLRELHLSPAARKRWIQQLPQRDRMELQEALAGDAHADLQAVLEDAQQILKGLDIPEALRNTLLAGLPDALLDWLLQARATRYTAAGLIRELIRQWAAAVQIPVRRMQEQTARAAYQLSAGAPVLTGWEMHPPPSENIRIFSMNPAALRKAIRRWIRVRPGVQASRDLLAQVHRQGQGRAILLALPLRERFQVLALLEPAMAAFLRTLLRDIRTLVLLAQPGSAWPSRENAFFWEPLLSLLLQRTRADYGQRSILRHLVQAQARLLRMTPAAWGDRLHSLARLHRDRLHLRNVLPGLLEQVHAGFPHPLERSAVPESEARPSGQKLPPAVQAVLQSFVRSLLHLHQLHPALPLSADALEKILWDTAIRIWEGRREEAGTAFWFRAVLWEAAGQQGTDAAGVIRTWAGSLSSALMEAEIAPELLLALETAAEAAPEPVTGMEHLLLGLLMPAGTLRPWLEGQAPLTETLTALLEPEAGGRISAARRVVLQAWSRHAGFAQAAASLDAASRSSLFQALIPGFSRFAEDLEQDMIRLLLHSSGQQQLSAAALLELRAALITAALRWRPGEDFREYLTRSLLRHAFPAPETLRQSLPHLRPQLSLGAWLTASLSAVLQPDMVPDTGDLSGFLRQGHLPPGQSPESFRARLLEMAAHQPAQTRRLLLQMGSEATMARSLRLLFPTAELSHLIARLGQYDSEPLLLALEEADALSRQSGALRGIGAVLRESLVVISLSGARAGHTGLLLEQALAELAPRLSLRTEALLQLLREQISGEDSAAPLLAMLTETLIRKLHIQTITPQVQASAEYMQLKDALRGEGGLPGTRHLEILLETYPELLEPTVQALRQRDRVRTEILQILSPASVRRVLAYLFPLDAARFEDLALLEQQWDRHTGKARPPQRVWSQLLDAVTASPVADFTHTATAWIDTAVPASQAGHAAAPRLRKLLNELLPVFRHPGTYTLMNRLLRRRVRALPPPVAQEKRAVRRFTEEDAGGVEYAVPNAGLALLWPFFPRYFELAGLMQHGNFPDDEAREKAVFLLPYLCRGDENPDEDALLIPKMFCGFHPRDPLTLTEYPISDEWKTVTASLLQAVIQYWTTLGDTKPDTLQEYFLNRPGTLIFSDERKVLRVEKNSVDLLIPTLPWGLSPVILPWIEDMIMVEWG